MVLTRVLLLSSALLLLASGRAAADWVVTPFLGMKFAGDTSFVDPERAAGERKLTLGASAGQLGEGPFGWEADVGVTPRFFQCGNCVRLVAGSNVTTLTGNVILAVPRRVTGESLRPYLVAGAGLLHVRISGLKGAVLVNSNLFGFDVGGGMIGPLTRRTSIRFELRQFRNLSQQEPAVSFSLGNTRLSFWRATAGLTIKY